MIAKGKYIPEWCMLQYLKKRDYTKYINTWYTTQYTLLDTAIYTMKRTIKDAKYGKLRRYGLVAIQRLPNPTIMGFYNITCEIHYGKDLKDSFSLVFKSIGEANFYRGAMMWYINSNRKIALGNIKTFINTI